MRNKTRKLILRLDPHNELLRSLVETLFTLGQSMIYTFLINKQFFCELRNQLLAHFFNTFSKPESEKFF